MSKLMTMDKICPYFSHNVFAFCFDLLLWKLTRKNALAPRDKLRVRCAVDNQPFLHSCWVASCIFRHVWRLARQFHWHCGHKSLSITTLHSSSQTFSWLLPSVWTIHGSSWYLKYSNDVFKRPLGRRCWPLAVFHLMETSYKIYRSYSWLLPAFVIFDWQTGDAAMIVFRSLQFFAQIIV